jgi:hypothetical protein
MPTGKRTIRSTNIQVKYYIFYCRRVQQRDHAAAAGHRKNIILQHLYSVMRSLRHTYVQKRDHSPLPTYNKEVIPQ